MKLLYNLLEYRNNYSRTSKSLFQYVRDEPTLNNDSTSVGFADSDFTNLSKLI